MIRVSAAWLIMTLSLIGTICAQYARRGWVIAATMMPILSTSTWHQANLADIGQGILNNLLLTMSESGDARIEMRQKPELAARFRPSEFRDRYKYAGTSPIAASEGTMGQGTATTRKPNISAIRYVSNGGSDANDGLSWDSAKATVFAALEALPGGSAIGPFAGSGTVYVGPGSSANPTANAGIWLMSGGDPNYASPPAGWLKCTSCILNIVGIPNALGGPNGHTPRVSLTGGSNADRNHPGLWIAGGGNGIMISNISFASSLQRAAVIGECSDHDRTGKCTVAGLTLQNDGIGVWSNPVAPGSGPALDITGASFWIFMRDCGFSGNAINAGGGYKANNAAGVLIDGSSNAGNGLIYMYDTNLAGGGVKVIPGSNGTSLYVNGIIEEGDFVHQMPPVVWFTNYNGFVDSTITNANLADPGPGNTPVIENDGQGPGPTIMGSAEGMIQGPATVLEQYNNAVVNGTISPLRQGQTGFFNGHVVGEEDHARRIGGLVPQRFVNKAATNTSSWSYTNSAGTQTFTQGLTDPYGGKGAASISSSGTTLENIQMGDCTAYTPAEGDWIVVGIWVKGWSPTFTALGATCYGFPSPSVSATFSNKGLMLGDGQWTYQWAASKVASGSATRLGAGGIFGNTITPTLYGPTLYVIPAGTLSDNEVLEFASSMAPVDSNCPVGSVCNVAGHPVVVSSYRTLSNCSSIASPAKCDSAPAGSFVLDVASTTARVNTTAVTANSQILIIEDSSLGAKLGISCNKTTGRIYMITDRVPGLSFTVSSSFAPSDHPACLSFQLLN